MATPLFSARTVTTCLEPVLADAVENNTTAGLRVARNYATFFTEADLELYHPKNIFQTFVAHFPPSSFTIEVDHVETERVGDPARMSACVAALLKAVERGPKTTLIVEVYEKEEHSEIIPRMSIAFSGPGRFPEHFRYENRFPMTLEELSDCWTLATSGGRIDRTENGLELRLTGMRMPPPPLDVAEQLVARMGREPDVAGAEGALKLIEDTTAPAMTDLERLYTETLDAGESALNQGGVAHSYSFSEDFPQLPLNRVRMQGFFANLFTWAIDAMANGGTLETLVEYDSRTREATAIISVVSVKDKICYTLHLALLKRAILFHGGTLDIDIEGAEVTITFTLADTVGQALDTWIPGWEHFKTESQKYLRLLKSGAQAPPEEFILGGILESELEAWLLPRLVEPATTVMANEGVFKNEGIKGSIKERIQKAIDQVKRGKPKKEICQPHYAGELFGAFRQDMRHRSALGTHVLTDDELQTLCEALLARPVEHLVCLVQLATLKERSVGVPSR